MVPIFEDDFDSYFLVFFAYFSPFSPKFRKIISMVILKGQSDTQTAKDLDDALSVKVYDKLEESD